MLDGAGRASAWKLPERVSMRRAAAALLLLLPSICACVEYPATGKDGKVWVVPDDYLVDPSFYPKYRAIRDFQPPDLMPNPYNEPHLRKPRIKASYVWEVRHRVNNQLWIYSEEYSKSGGSNAEIAITPEGLVLPGWRGISNPKRVVMRGDRAIPLDAPHYLNWGNEPLFEPIK